MANYFVSDENWNDPNFWQTLISSGAVDTLNFSALPDT